MVTATVSLQQQVYAIETYLMTLTLPGNLFFEGTKYSTQEGDLFSFVQVEPKTTRYELCTTQEGEVIITTQAKNKVEVYNQIDQMTLEYKRVQASTSNGPQNIYFKGRNILTSTYLDDGTYFVRAVYYYQIG